MSMVKVGESIRAARKQKGWTQEDLATRAGISRDLVSRLERGAFVEVGVRKVDRVCVALKLDLVAMPFKIDRVSS